MPSMVVPQHERPLSPIQINFEAFHLIFACDLGTELFSVHICCVSVFQTQVFDSCVVDV